MTQEQKELFRQFLNSVEYYTISKRVGTGTSVYTVSFMDQETDEEICTIPIHVYKPRKSNEYLPSGDLDKDKFRKAKEISKNTFVTIDDYKTIQ